MIDIQDRKVMACPLNGKVCCNGIREDFPEDATTKQKIPCRLWTIVQGADAQDPSKKDVLKGDCAMAWMPTIFLEGNMLTRQVSAEVLEHRNIFVDALPPHVKDRLVQNGNHRERLP